MQRGLTPIDLQRTTLAWSTSVNGVLAFISQASSIMAWFSATFCLLSLPMLFSWVWASDPVEVAKFGLYRTASLDLDENGQADLFLENPPKDFGFGESVLRPRIFVEHISDTIVRVTIRDPESKRWEVPDIVQTPIKTRKTNAYLKVTLTSDNVTGTGFQVHRRLHGHFQTIFDAHGIVFADRFLRIRTHLPNNPYIYGLGERVTSLRLPVNQTFSIMATDQLTPSLKPLYGSHPFYMEVREGGIAHGVFALNSNPMEIDLDHNSLTYRFLGGIFDFYFMAGPKPKDVVEQYHAIIGRPSLPPSWHFGFHQCRWGYKDLQILENVISNYTNNGIPLDTIWNDLDYMDGYRIFTSDSERFPQTSFKEFLESLHSQKRHYIPIIDPGVKIDPGYQTYKEGVQENVFLPAVSNPFTDDKFFVGQVWPGLVHFPDWTHPNTTRWWSNQIQRFHQKVPIDGLWTDMNEAANFCDGRCVLSASKLFNGSNSDNCNFCGQVLDTNLYDHPWPKSVRDPLPDRPCHAAYRTSGLDCGSISMGVQHYNGAYEYDMHNLFGHMEAVATYKGLIDATGSRPVIVTRSTYPGSGRFATHWLGDNYSSFESMRQSIPGMLNMGLFGVSMVGADICGFAGDTTAELCIRWFQLGSFYPFARNHNILFSNVAQEAYAFGPDATDCIRTALILRYRLYYYIYSVAALAALNGGAIARPVMLEFPQDKLTWNTDEQFMLGSSLMICPQLYEGKDHVNCYLPPSALWYTLEGEMIESGDRFPSPLNATAPTFIQGGFIVPLSSSPGLTIADTRTSDFSLLIALDRKNRAIGSMYFDDGKSLNSIESQNYTLVEYSAHSDAWPKEGSKIQIQLALTRTNFPETVRLSEIQIFPKCAGAVKFSENRLNGQLSLSVNEPFVLQAFCLPEEPSFNLPAVAFE